MTSAGGEIGPAGRVVMGCTVLAIMTPMYRPRATLNEVPFRSSAIRPEPTGSRRGWSKRPPPPKVGEVGLADRRVPEGVEHLESWRGCMPAQCRRGQTPLLAGL